MLVKTQSYVILVNHFNVMLVKTQNYLISVYCIAENFRQEFNFVAFVRAIFLTKLNS